MSRSVLRLWSRKLRRALARLLLGKYPAPSDRLSLMLLDRAIKEAEQRGKEPKENPPGVGGHLRAENLTYSRPGRPGLSETDLTYLEEFGGLEKLLQRVKQKK